MVEVGSVLSSGATPANDGNPLTTPSEVDAVMAASQIRMAGRKHQAEIISKQLEFGETVVDVVKAYRVLVDGKKLGTSSGFTLVFLTNRRIIVASGGDTSLPLSEIASVSDLTKGKFRWVGTNGEEWAFEHAQGIVHRNGNQGNTTRFYDSMKRAVASP